MLEHNDMSQDANMISSVLRKVADEMEQMESDRIMPDHMKPKMEVAKVSMEAKPEDAIMDESGMDSQDSSLDPDVLKELMDKAGSADETGATPDDQLDEFDPEIAALIRKKKELK